jgi:hypothetical protein
MGIRVKRVSRYGSHPACSNNVYSRFIVKSTQRREQGSFSGEQTRLFFILLTNQPLQRPTQAPPEKKHKAGNAATSNSAGPSAPFNIHINEESSNSPRLSKSPRGARSMVPHAPSASPARKNLAYVVSLLSHVLGLDKA